MLINMIRPLKKGIERYFKIRLIKKMPRGLSFTDDIKKLLDANIIFDIGANIGQSALPYSEIFSNSLIYCFEPCKATFEDLKKNISKKNIQAIHSAVGSKTGLTTLAHAERSTLNKIHERCDELAEGYEQTPIITLDEFCEKASIKHIDILKIDTEGHDLEVLKGARNLIFAGQISVVYVETGMSSTNNRHVPFEIINTFMQENGYSIFGIYEQSYEWINKKPYLRRANIAYISENLSQQHYEG